MSLTLNRDAYLQLIAQDMEWMDTWPVPHSLEADHIRAVLKASVLYYYPEAELPKNLLEDLHRVFTKHGIASYDGQLMGLVTDVVQWAVMAWKQSPWVEKQERWACLYCSRVERRVDRDPVTHAVGELCPRRRHPSNDPRWAEKRVTQEEGHDVTAGGECGEFSPEHFDDGSGTLLDPTNDDHEAAIEAYAQSVTQSVEALTDTQKQAVVEDVVVKTEYYDSPLLQQIEFQKKRGYAYFGCDAATRQYLWRKIVVPPVQGV